MSAGNRQLFDASGKEVLITMVCTRCRVMKPFSAFGIRTMPDGTRRSISQCSPCRGVRRLEVLNRKEWSRGGDA